MDREACSWLRPLSPIGRSSCPPVTELLCFYPISVRAPTARSVSCSKSDLTSPSPLSTTGPHSRRRRPSADVSSEFLRHWVEAHQRFPSQERFIVASYNILADRNASKHKDLYPNVPSCYMKWDYRKRLICEELIGWSPDIICMQEVDKYFDIKSMMERSGYCSCYKRRTGNNVDGCATFWRTNKFRLLDRESIEFKDYGLRDNVAQLSVFEMCGTKSRRLVVGNIHVLYNTRRGDVKLGQIRFLSSMAKLLSQKWGNIPVVLGGDFNCTPKSAVYKFLLSSELNIKLYDKEELSGQRSCHPSQVFGVQKVTKSPFFVVDRFLKKFWTNEDIKLATGSPEGDLAVHPLKLGSSYATVTGSANTRDFNGEPLATSYHSKFLGTVDYLWYSDGLIPTRVLDTLPIEILRRTGGLPSKKAGSDHLALISEFTFNQARDNNHWGLQEPS